MRRAVVTRLERLEAVAAAAARASFDGFMESLADDELDVLAGGSELDDLTDDELDRLAETGIETAADWTRLEAEARAIVGTYRGQA